MADTITRGFKKVFTDFVEQKIEFLLCLSRVGCMGLTVAFYMASLGLIYDYTSWYRKALIANAIISALRLHQRMPVVPLNPRALTAKLAEEDSGHYLIYSLVFLFGSPISLALIPPALFSLINSLHFAIEYLQRNGQQDSAQAQFLIQFYHNQRLNMLQLIAMIEILLVPSILVGLYSGHSWFFMPFVYYHFLMFRYASRRNPYSRYFCRELRQQFEGLSNHPKCPGGVSSAIHKIIGVLCSIAPPVNAAG